MSQSPHPERNVTTGTSGNVHPSDRFHVLNSLALLDDDDTPEELNDGHQINALYLSSPLSCSLPDLFPSYDAFALSSSPAPASPRVSFAGITTLLPGSPLGLSLAVNENPLDFASDIIDLTLEDINDAADPILFASRPPSPAVAPVPSSAQPPTNIVEDDKLSTEGMKTSKSSVLDSLKPVNEPPRQKAAAQKDDEDDWTLFAPKISPVTQQTTLKNEPTTQEGISAYTSPPRHINIFPYNAFERPHDPDEVTPNTPHADHVVAKPRPSNPVAARLDQPSDSAQHPLIRTRRQQPRARTSQNRDRQASTEEPRNIPPEPTPRPNHCVLPHASRIPVSDHFTFAPDPRNYAYNYKYPDNRFEE
ncbi:hypothetical protein EDB85DRAFT_2153139 [Lactarius pseudohatsudake]|nr:hypothetical protein EDB85DRAFT_2153139 [Lactarius pseudohatsudake]